MSSPAPKAASKVVAEVVAFVKKHALVVAVGVAANVVGAVFRV